MGSDGRSGVEVRIRVTSAIIRFEKGTLTMKSDATENSDSLRCSSSFVLFLQWLKIRLKESNDAELRNDVLLRINANFREEMMRAKK